MVANFYADLSRAHVAEKMVADIFRGLTDKYNFTWVGNEEEYYHKGDIIATTKDGRKIFIEVKNDSRIGQTRNVLCEEIVDYFKPIKDKPNYFTRESKKGNMYSNYQIYCVVSHETKEIFVIDFKKLKEFYRQYRYISITHEEQETHGYLVPLDKIKACGGLIATIGF